LRVGSARLRPLREFILLASTPGVLPGGCAVGKTMPNKEQISPEIIAAIKDIVPEVLGVNFDELFEAYRKNIPIKN